MNNNDWQTCLIHGDSKDVIKRIPDNSVDFILTDPPYNLGQHSTGNIPLPGRTAMNNDIAHWDNIDFNPEEWADEFIRILKPNGNLFIFTSYNQIGRWYNCLDHKFDTSNFMIWHKTNPAPKIYKAGFLNSCEMIFTCWNKGHKWNFISQADMHNFIESPICMRPERLNNPKHPTQKPVAILKKMIEIATNPGDIIFDPFMGVGSIGAAAVELNRKFIGVELEKDYYLAARSRVKNIEMQNSYNKENNLGSSTAEEPAVEYESLPRIFDNWDVSIIKRDLSTGLQPIIKWPGGKEKELKYIIPAAPAFKRLFDPFVGGGSVFMGLQAKEYVINDLSHELIGLYQNIKNQNTRFFNLCNQIDASWVAIGELAMSTGNFIEIFKTYRQNELNDKQLKEAITSLCQAYKSNFSSILGPEFNKQRHIFNKEIITNLYRKMVRMKQLETQKHVLPNKDLRDNIECAMKSALYMYYRALYNDADISDNDDIMHTALFFFIRNYAYSGMFRYSSKGLFNVPYGGIAYNSKTLKKKLDYYQSVEVINHFAKTSIYNEDFEKFLETNSPEENDFIFLDPPYDSEFSTYAQNEFTRNDQQRLANYLINRCPAKWMLIIKNTDFIFGLYDKPGINIKSFDKEYVVSFMNRNDKKVTHLLITNY